MENQASTYQVWLPVVGKALCYIALNQSNMHDKTTAEKAMFLEAFGLGRKDVAEMLGTSYASVTELLRQAKKKKEKKKNG